MERSNLTTLVTLSLLSLEFQVPSRHRMRRRAIFASLLLFCGCYSRVLSLSECYGSQLGYWEIRFPLDSVPAGLSYSLIVVGYTGVPVKVTKAVLPVAGLGTRFLPASKAIPKEMVTVVDKPVIQYVVEEALAAGINEIVLVTHSSKKAIEDHFDVNYELEAEL